MKEPVKNKIVERLTQEFNPDFLEVICASVCLRKVKKSCAWTTFSQDEEKTSLICWITQISN